MAVAAEQTPTTRSPALGALARSKGLSPAFIPPPSPSANLADQNGSRTPKWFYLPSTVVRKCCLSAEKTVVAPPATPSPPPPAPPPPCFTSNIFLNQPERRKRTALSAGVADLLLYSLNAAHELLSASRLLRWPVPVSTLRSPAAVRTLPQALGANVGRPLSGVRKGIRSDLR